MGIRDGPGWGIYYGIYQFLKDIGERNNYWTKDEQKRKYKRFFYLMNAGGIGGTIAWSYEIPFDIIKTRQ